MTEPDPRGRGSAPPTRRALREAQERARAGGRRKRASRRQVLLPMVVTAVAVAVVVGVGLTAQRFTAAPSVVDAGQDPDAVVAEVHPGPAATPGRQIPAPTITARPASVPICARPAFLAALEAHDDAKAVRLIGARGFRAAVADATAPCIPMDDSSRLWAVSDKHRPHQPIDYAPAPLVRPKDVRNVFGMSLREDAADALTAMARAAGADGAGQIALQSGYRSYRTQQSTYAGHVKARGKAGADLVSARPGYSEHQLGITADVVACDGGCGSLDDLAGTAQGDWIVKHSWQYGWIVRYEKGRTDTTGYSPEPWHLRYIGKDLAKAYHKGGFHTLEDFFGLPPAPDYPD